MRRLLVPLTLLALSGSVFASDWASSERSCFKKGNLCIGGGFRLGDVGAFASADYGIHDAFSLGGALGYSGNPDVWGRLNKIPIYVRGAFHPFNLKAFDYGLYNVRNRLDLFAGIAAGYTIAWWSNTDIHPDHPPFIFPLREYFGVKIYPKGKFYFSVEEAGGLSWINLGIGYKFR